ncbi:DUF6241 domain-containing protein [Halobacillus sp. Cin3]|uniref:DUF6241 domain-containing protein n=1 Tax=Halobacillus sp. Cin3 TaxID=2928441 RepID=UPI00248E1B25|nr:DUF6241 domain-containing protein [Halobacillus sp. Cin3]
MKKWILSTALLLLAAAGTGWYLMSTQAEAMTEQEVKEAVEKSAEEADEKLQTYEEEGKNPFGSEKRQNELTDSDYQSYIHSMSHQKVKADKKWGFTTIHPERIDWLLEGLDQTTLTHRQTYEEILTKWHAGDFSTADEDHNRIWTLQNGNVGKATGLLSPQEEAQLMQKRKN